jgi:hypothetical protein
MSRLSQLAPFLTFHEIPPSTRSDAPSRQPSLILFSLGLIHVMADSENTIYIEHHTSRESYTTLIGTPSALRGLSTALGKAVDSVPSDLPSAQNLSLGITTEAADGSRRETFLSLRAEPSDDWLVRQRSRRRTRDWLVIALLIAFCVFAVIGLGSTVRWLFHQ